MSTRTLKIATGHTVAVESIDALPAPNFPHADGYSKFYVVKNEGTDRVFLYLATGHAKAKREIVAWYPATRKMWNSFGTTLQSAIDGAVRDGWLYA